jgi:hypothetical protein
MEFNRSRTPRLQRDLFAVFLVVKEEGIVLRLSGCCTTFPSDVEATEVVQQLINLLLALRIVEQRRDDARVGLRAGINPGEDALQVEGGEATPVSLPILVLAVARRGPCPARLSG